MAASSPYQNNDYQAVSNYRPYELPVNDIFKALTSQDKFWRDGAAKVNSVYDTALNLKLSLEPNKELRRKFMEQAEKELTKLSSKDVSNPAVQREGYNIFKPLLQDEGIAYDDAMTRHYEDVRADALNYRDKDGGKEYSDTNLAYAMDGYNEFVNSKDRMAGKAFYQKKKEYTPFYDPTSELSGILKNCKPSQATNESVQGYYINSYSNDSLSAAKVNTCLDGGLSDRAKRQMQINGYVTYRNNPEALRDQYIPHLQGTISQLAEESAAIRGVLANKNNLKNLKKEDLHKIGLSDSSQVTPELIQALENQARNNDDRTQNMTSSISKMLSGDLRDLTGENFEAISGAMYSRDYIKNIAEGFSYDFTKNTKKADPIQMMFYQQHEQNARQEDQQQHDLQLKQLDIQGDLAVKQLGLVQKGNIKLLLGTGNEDIIDQARIQNDTNSPWTTIDKTQSYDEVTAKRTELAGKTGELNNWLVKELKNYGLDASVTKTEDPRFSNFYETFKTTAKSDPEKTKLINEYEQQLGKYVSLQDLYKNTQESVDTKLIPERKQLDNTRSQLAALGNVSIPLGQGNYSTNNLNSVPKGGTVINKNLAQIADDVLAGIASIRKDNALLGNVQLVYNIGGQEYSIEVPKSSHAAQPILHVADYLANNGRKERQIVQKRNELMQAETVLQKEGYNFPFLNSNNLADPQKGEQAGFKERLAQAIQLPLKYIDDISVGQTDGNGRLIVTLNRDRVKATKEYDPDQILKNLKTYNGRDNKEVPNNSSSIVLEGISVLDLIDENSMSSIMKPYIRSLENRTSSIADKSTGFIRSVVNNRNYRLDVSRSFNGNFNYKIIDKDDPSSPVYSSSNRDDILGKFQTLIQEKAPEVPVKR